MDINAAFKISAGVSGTDAITKLVRELRSASSAQSDNADEGKKLLGVLKEQVAAVEMSEGEFLRYRAALAGVRDQAEPMIVAMEELRSAALQKANADAVAARELRSAQKEEAAALASKQAFLRSLQDQAATTGKSQDEILAYRAAQLGLTKEAEPFIAKIKEANAALYGSGANARIAANAMRQLPAQFNDVVVSLAGGQNPFMVLLQQGSQVVDSFGGIGNATRSITALFTPFRVAVGGAAAILAVLGLAAYKADADLENMQRSILQTGNAAGVTRDKIAAMAKAAQESSGLTVGQSKDVVSSVVASGAFGPGTVDAASVAVANFQKLFNTTAEDAAKGFAKMREGVSKWANEYAAKYSLIKAADLERIRIIENTQGKEAAMRETLALVTAELQKRNGVMQEEVGWLGKIIEGWEKLGSYGWDKLKGVFTPDTAAVALAKLRSDLKESEIAMQRFQRASNTPQSVLDTYQKHINYIRARISEQEKLIASTEKQAAADARAAEQAKKYGDEMAKMADYSRAERGYTESAQALQNFSKRAMYELQMAAYQSERNRGLYTEYDYTQRVYDLKLKLLKADADEKMQALMRAKYDQDQALATGDMLAQLNARTAYNKALKESRDAQLALNVAQEAGSGAAYGMAATAKTEELQNQAKVLREQLATIKAMGTAMPQSVVGSLGRDLSSKNGAFFGATDKQKQDLIAAAKVVDDLNAQIKLGSAAAEYQKQTDTMNAETAALGANAKQKELIIAKQDLENRGIKEGTELYDQLMAKRTEAIQKASEAASTWQVGMKQGINEYLESAGNMAVQTKEVVTQAFTHMEDALVNFAMTGKLNFRDLANSIIADLIRMQARLAVSGFANALGGAGGITSAIGSFFGPSVIGSAKGNAFNGGQRVTAFARGGAFTNTVATQPTIAPMALFGEAGPEAIMPLARDSSGRLGVRAQGGSNSGGDTITVQVVVNMAEGTTQTSTSGTGDAEAAKQIGNTVAALVKKQLVEEMRNPGGLLYAGRRS